MFYVYLCIQTYILNMANLMEIAKLLEVEEVDLLREDNIDR